MNLLNLLMQSIAAGDEEEKVLTDEGYDPNAPIEVMAGRQRSQPERPVYGDPQEREIIRQRYILNDDRMAPTREELREIVPRSQGYFGSKGTLRDILGGISDAFLVQGGGDFEYQKLRDRERKGDAMFGFTDNPRQAMERLAAGGYTDDAEELQKNFATQEQNERILASQDAGRQSLSRDRATDNKAAGFKQLGRLAYAGAPMSVMRAAARNAGITEAEMAELGINENMTAAQRQQLGAIDEGVYQQRRFPLEERRVEVAERGAAVGEQNAQSNRIRANRPPAARAPARPESASEYEARIRNKIGKGTATKAEIESITLGKGRSSGRSDRRQVTPPGKFQNWSSKPIN